MMKKLVMMLMLVCLLAGCSNLPSPQENGSGAGNDMNSVGIIGGSDGPTAIFVTPEGEDDATIDDSQLVTEDTDSGEALQEYDTFSSEEFTISIPISWRDKYIIQDGQDGFAIIQKASYEKEEGMGMLCCFYRSDNMIDQSAGATQLAYTDDYMYYMQVPTDVNFYVEDDAIAGEYLEMAEEVESIANSLIIDAENVRYDAREYVLPMSHVKEIPEHLLINMSAEQLWIARNEIFARYGREFDNSYLAGYFASCTWYTPQMSADAFDESILTEAEIKNLEKISAAEKEQNEQKVFPNSCLFGEDYTYDLDGDGTKETFNITLRANPEESLGYEPSFAVNQAVAVNMSRDEVYITTPNEEEYFVTDISPYYEGLEIAIMDYGMSDDLVTYFYAYDEGFQYIGSVEGFPFKKYMGRDGFEWEGSVKGELRTELTHSASCYATWYYDYDNQILKLQDTGMMQMVPDGGHRLLEDIELYVTNSTDSAKITLKAQDQVFFMETDAKEWVKLKGKDGTIGYAHITDHKIDGVEKDPTEIIEGIHFAG